MHAHLIISALGLSAVIATFQATRGDSGPSEAAPVTISQTKPASAARRDFGHLILQIEGDANRLSVTRITPKKSACNRDARVSPFRVVLLDAAGQTLGSYPLDLSMFDMNPAQAGKPLRVQGCEVRDTRVAALANVPYFASATALRILRGGQLLGALDHVAYEKLVAQGEVR